MGGRERTAEFGHSKTPQALTCNQNLFFINMRAVKQNAWFLLVLMNKYIIHFSPSVSGNPMLSGNGHGGNAAEAEKPQRAANALC